MTALSNSYRIRGYPDRWRMDNMVGRAMLTRKDGMVKGDRRCTPRESVMRTALTMAGKPPMPEAMIVAVRSHPSAPVGLQPTWATASSAAAKANRMKRSILR